jgi:mannosyltransferase
MGDLRWRFPIILLAALAVRCIAISGRGIQYDDAFSIFLAGRPLAEIVAGTAADTMPPLFYFILHFWQMISTDLVWIRLLGVLLSLAAIVFLYLLTARLVSRSAGLWVAFLAAISPLQYYHAQDVRMYTLLAVCQLSYTWFFTRIWLEPERSNKLNWAGLILSGAAGMYTHNLAIFGLVVPNFILLIQRDWKRLGQLVLAQLVIGFIFLPWLVLLPGQLAKVQRAFWTPVPGPVEIINALIISTTNLPLPGVWLVVGLSLSMVLFLLVIWLILRKGLNIQKGFLLALTFLPPALLFVASYLTRPVFVPRGFITSTLAYLALAAVIIACQTPRAPGWILTGGFVGAALMGVYFQSGYSLFPFSPFERAGRYLETVTEPDDAIVHDNKLSYFPTAYYEPGLKQEFLVDQPGSPNDTLAPATQSAMGRIAAADLKQAIGSSQRVFFVVFDKTISEYIAMGQEHPQLAWLRQNLKETDRVSFQDLKIILFEKPPQ